MLLRASKARLAYAKATVAAALMLSSVPQRSRRMPRARRAFDSFIENIRIYHGHITGAAADDAVSILFQAPMSILEVRR